MLKCLIKFILIFVNYDYICHSIVTRNIKLICNILIKEYGKRSYDGAITLNSQYNKIFLFNINLCKEIRKKGRQNSVILCFPLLGIHCTGGQKYQVCGNSCARTCLDLATNVDCQRKCVEGCNCLEGFSLDSSGICVPITECPCVYQAKEYKPGYEMMQIQPDGTYRVW